MDSKYFDKDQNVYYKEISGVTPKVKFPADKNENPICTICYEKKSKTEFSIGSCGHSLCNKCWREYVLYMGKDFSTGAFYKCPFEKCNLTLPESFVLQFLDEEGKRLYFKKLCKSFCEESKTIRFCPSPGCIYSVENVELTRVEIKCVCKTLFCFKCGKEAHTPCSCKQVSEWELKTSSESENVRWIQINTKLCPKCRKPIEKNQGCNHMTCRSLGCNYEFCWLCMGDWKEHGNNTGGYYKCNKYEEMSTEEKEKKSKDIDKEKSLLEKYLFYFDRYHNNRVSQEKALETAKSIDGKIKEFHEVLKLDLSDLQFLSEAGEYLVDARRILKYSYVFGFYLVEKQEKELFEFNQSDFEKNCEILHGLLEKKEYKEEFFAEDGGRTKFYNYKQHIVDVTQATKKFMNGFLSSIENGILNEKNVMLYK